MSEETKDYSVTGRASAGSSPPVLVLMFEAGRPASRPIALGVGRSVVVGRDAGADLAIPLDDRMSKRHARIAAVDDGFEVEDLGSRNGTFVDGHEVRSALRRVEGDATVVVGSSIITAVRDGARFSSGSVEVTDVVLDPMTRSALDTIASVAVKGHPLLIVAETGSGKEHAMQVYHRATHCAGPLVTINCNNLDPQLADAALFGAKRGSHSTAMTDADGAFDAADGGVLALDEVQDLTLPVQGKILRAVEEQAFVPLGTTTPKKVNVRIVCATNAAIRGLVEEGKFRRDLYHRLAQVSVELPPLRARPEAMPHLIALEAARQDAALRVRFDFVEACLLRPWPGNVRELFGAVKTAVERAQAEGSERLMAKHLDRTAGFPEHAAPTMVMTPSKPPAMRPSTAPSSLPSRRDLKREAFRTLYLQLMANRPGEKVATLMAEIAERLGISKSTAFEWAKEFRAGEER